MLKEHIERQGKENIKTERKQKKNKMSDSRISYQ